jgi:hypothetical protein
MRILTPVLKFFPSFRLRCTMVKKPVLDRYPTKVKVSQYIPVLASYFFFFNNHWLGFFLFFPFFWDAPQRLSIIPKKIDCQVGYQKTLSNNFQLCTSVHYQITSWNYMLSCQLLPSDKVLYFLIDHFFLFL